MSVHHVHGPTVIAGCCNVIIVDGTPIAAVLAGEAIANDLPFGAVVAIATLADCVLVPQIMNAKRFDCRLDHVPEVMRVFANCMKLDAFEHTRPEHCPDAD